MERNFIDVFIHRMNEIIVFLFLLQISARRRNPRIPDLRRTHFRVLDAQTSGIHLGGLNQMYCSVLRDASLDDYLHVLNKKE